MDASEQTETGVYTCPTCDSFEAYLWATMARHLDRCRRRRVRELVEERAANRSMLARFDGLDGFRAFVLVVVAALALLSMPMRAEAAPAAWTNPTLSQLASTYVGHAVTVTCSETPDSFVEEAREAGLVVAPEAFAEPWNETAFLRGDDCRQVAQVALGRPVKSLKSAGMMALVLTHEATHLLGIYDEGQTECLARANVWRMLGLMGLTGKRRSIAYAGAMAEDAAMPAAYHSVTVC